MAKTKLINEIIMSFDININSKDYNYKYATTDNTQISFIVKNIEGYEREAYLIKDGQNLKYVAIYSDNLGKTKKIITNTLLDYYSHAEKYTADQVLSNVYINKTYTQVSGKTLISSSGNKYAGSNKNDTFVVINTNNYFIDFKGNDTYKIEPLYNTNTHNTIYDYTGNDKYAVTAVKEFTVVNISDYSGNDFYNFTGLNFISSGDHGGNDMYNIYGSDCTLYDYAGKDNYNINYSNVNIIDKGGSDKYNANNSRVVVREHFKGNDIYNLSRLQLSSWIEEDFGNDKYYIDYAIGTNEPEDDISITDKSGKDIYSISNSK